MENGNLKDIEKCLTMAADAFKESHVEKACFWAMSLAFELNLAAGGELIPKEVATQIVTAMHKVYDLYIIPR